MSVKYNGKELDELERIFDDAEVVKDTDYVDLQTNKIAGIEAVAQAVCPQWVSVEERLPKQVERYGDCKKNLPYVIAIDAKNRQSIGYCIKYSTGEVGWVFAKPIGKPTHWTPLMPAPDPR